MSVLSQHRGFIDSVQLVKGHYGEGVEMKSEGMHPLALLLEVITDHSLSMPELRPAPPLGRS